MSALTFEPYDEEGHPRVFAGLFRPPFESLTHEEWEALLPPGSYAIPQDLPRRRWLAGALDRPLYFEQITYALPELAP